ncbi:uncharacterized protein [Dermacentor albipictus]|uniref:uncharacterized protein n=1 Tax=Dermacentor albipictus TaxID=60249 RepID=UPI0038FC243D
MAEESSNECMPLDLSMKAKATPSTAHDGTQGASSTLGAYRTISEDALRYPRNTQHTPTTDETCNIDGPNTSRAGMEEASASFEDGARIATETGGREQQVSSGVSGKVSSRRDASHGQPNEPTGGTAPILRARDRSHM